MAEKKVVGAGAILRDGSGTLYLQERDEHAPVNPNRIGPFGGGIEAGESDTECVIRELEEELRIQVTEDELTRLDLFESDTGSGKWLSLFLIDRDVFVGLDLQEGRAIAELTTAEAMQNELVTDFTKRVLDFIEKHAL